MKAIRKESDSKFLNRILILSALIILLSSIEALFLAKDIGNYQAYRESFAEASFNDYINLILFNMFLVVLNPIIISLYTFFTIDRFKINDIYKMFFGFSTVITLFYYIFQFRIRSIFYYLVIILNIVLLITIVSKERT